MALNLEALRLSTNFPTVVKTEQCLTTIPVRKPKKSEFFRVREGWSFDAFLLDLKEDEEKYLVMPEFQQILLERNLLRRVRFYFLVSWGSGVMYLSEIPLPDEDGKFNDFNKSRMEHYETAKTKWVSISANKSLGAYTINIAKGNLPEPIWALKPASIEEAIEIAFKDKVIDKEDHPILKKLRGEV